MKMLEPFEAATGIRVEFTGTRDLPAVLTRLVAIGNPPDVSALPNPGQMHEFAKIKALVDLSEFMDMSKLQDEYGKTWIDLGSYRGTLYSIFISADLKSLVWYNPKAFTNAGYQIPQTWDELMALSDKIAAQGRSPWSIGLESGAASSWPGTDWIEDIMLRTAGPQVYDKWVNHEISWTDPRVKRAWELFGRIARNEKYVYGGPATALTTNFGEAASILASTQTFRFDGSDLMPAAVGSGSFWSGILDYVGGEDLDSVLERIEETATKIDL